MVQLYHNRNVNKNSLLFKVDYTRTLGDEKLFVVCNFREQEMDFTLEDGFTGDEKVLISNYDDVVKTENGIYLRPYEAKVFYRK